MRASQKYAATGWSNAHAKSAPHQCLQMFGVAGALHLHSRERALDVADIACHKLDAGGAGVLLKAIELSGAGDRHDPRLLRQQPGERDLRRCRSLLLRDPAELIDQRLIGLARLGEKRGTTLRPGTATGRSNRRPRSCLPSRGPGQAARRRGAARPRAGGLVSAVFGLSPLLSKPPAIDAGIRPVGRCAAPPGLVAETFVKSSRPFFIMNSCNTDFVRRWRLSRWSAQRCRLRRLSPRTPRRSSCESSPSTISTAICGRRRAGSGSPIPATRPKRSRCRPAAPSPWRRWSGSSARATGTRSSSRPET